MLFVTDNASGIERISASSPAENPLCTSAEYPPIKLTPVASAAFCKVLAYITGFPPLAAAIMAMGVTEIRLFIMGIPNSLSISSPTLTRFPARRVILS